MVDPASPADTNVVGIPSKSTRARLRAKASRWLRIVGHGNLGIELNQIALSTTKRPHYAKLSNSDIVTAGGTDPSSSDLNWNSMEVSKYNPLVLENHFGAREFEHGACLTNAASLANREAKERARNAGDVIKHNETSFRA
ncbi:hypothetical protein EVAR_60784_1 [Eumeta japonica]|uniref:Uncharacterized protein n=1 Tax=Eumeta variegata TaxID=151549 RepID=A0A4C1ZU71_EUMVA|nr:hypothetical protein EVAR_60784_1 [Eumeta japonica]